MDIWARKSGITNIRQPSPHGNWGFCHVGQLLPRASGASVLKLKGQGNSERMRQLSGMLLRKGMEGYHEGK